MNGYDPSVLPDKPQRQGLGLSPLPDLPAASADRIPEFTHEHASDIGPTPLDLIRETPRLPERLYRENAPQIREDARDRAESGPTVVGPLHEHTMRPKFFLRTLFVFSYAKMLFFLSSHVGLMDKQVPADSDVLIRM